MLSGLLNMKEAKKIYVELADNHIKREYGLKNRKKLSENSGMLFCFPKETRMSFWMADTYIPLDIAFIDKKGIVSQIETMSPLNTKAFISKDLCKYALEVNKGWFAKNDIGVGSKIAGRGMGSDAFCKISQEQQAQEQQNPDVVLNKSYKEIIEEATDANESLILIYQTKEGLVLPPKTISPPFEFEEDAKGKKNSIVKAWDQQTGGWKSFLVDNILKIDSVKKKEDIAEPVKK